MIDRLERELEFLPGNAKLLLLATHKHFKAHEIIQPNAQNTLLPETHHKGPTSNKNGAISNPKCHKNTGAVSEITRIP